MAQQQTSIDYSVDNRYSETQYASDNNEGKHFLNRYIDAKKEASKTNLTQERKEDNHFIMSAPGLGTNFKFTNAFSAEKSPLQRRLNRMAE